MIGGMVLSFRWSLAAWV